MREETITALWITYRMVLFVRARARSLYDNLSCLFFLMGLIAALILIYARRHHYILGDAAVIISFHAGVFKNTDGIYIYIYNTHQQTTECYSSRDRKPYYTLTSACYLVYILVSLYIQYNIIKDRLPPVIRSVYKAGVGIFSKLDDTYIGSIIDPLMGVHILICV